MLMYSAYKGGEKWQKLTTAAKHFKFDFSAHDSLEDVKATLHCYKNYTIRDDAEVDYSDPFESKQNMEK